MSLSNNFPTIRPTLNLDFANSGVLDPRITFTRATSATYYDAETVALAEQNLLQQSQTFENSYWTKEFVTVTADDAVAPDGTTTADKIIEDTTNAGHRVYATVNGVLSGSVYTFSCFIKKNERQYAILTTYDTVTRYRVFDLTNGVLGGSSANITSSSITSFGNGWYRCSIAWTTTATQVFPYVGLASGDTNAAYVGNGSSMWAWGAQLELRSAATAYTPTTTQAVTNYVPQLMTAAIGQPRFDYDPVTRVAKGLLIEEARTNLCPNSDQFDDVTWTKVGSSVTANTTVAPNGTITADSLTESATTGRHFTFKYLGATASTIYTGSFYLKYQSRRYVVVSLKGYTGAAATVAFSQVVDLQNLILGAGTNTVGSPTGTSASLQVVGNGWVRVSVSMNVGAGATAVYLSACLSNSATPSYNEEAPTYTGDGISSTYVWGAQLEVGTFPTSYIPTVASTVQRNADVVTMTGTNFSSWYNSSAGTMFVQASAFAPATNLLVRNVISFNDNTGATINNLNRIYLYDVSVGGNTRVAGSNQSDLFSSYTVNVPFKAAYAFATNDFSFSRNGSTPSTDTSGNIPTVNAAQIGSYAGQNQFNGWMQFIRYYPLRLTDTQLQNLTKS